MAGRLPLVVLGFTSCIILGCSNVDFATTPAAGGDNTPTACVGLICDGPPAPGSSPIGTDPNDPPGGTPVPTPTPIDNGSLIRVQDSISVVNATKKVDVLFVIDNSGSMAQDIQTLYTKFPNFISSLSGLDWQVCVTLTDMAGSYDGTRGHLRQFPNGSKFINTSTTDANAQFTGVMQALIAQGTGSSDERGIYAINEAVRLNEGCFRSDATLHTVVISDEDERSTGGDQTYANGGSQYRALQDVDFANALFTQMDATFGVGGKIYTHHSLIIQPNDNACFTEQSKASAVFFGRLYSDLTAKTKGIQGSICSADYGAQLNAIGTVVQKTLDAVPLRCNPVGSDGTPLTLPSQIIKSVSPASVAATATLEGNKLKFSPALPGGTVLNVEYYCIR